MAKTTLAPPVASAPPAPESHQKPRHRRSLAPFALIAPAIIMLAVFIGWPLVQMIVMSFQEFGRAQIFGTPAEFIGIDNYIAVLTDSEFWMVLARSILLCLACVTATMVLGVLIALMMKSLGTVMRTALSISLLLAWAMPALTATIVWGWIFDTQYGLVNYFLTQVTGTDWTGHSWLIDPLSFFAVAAIIITWGAIPFVAFTAYAGLTQVPDEVLEAASLDGAGPAQRFRLVTLPYIRSILIVLLILQVIWDLRVFAQIYALQTIGGVRADTNTIGVYIYSVSMASGDLGAGGAISVILVVIMLLIAAYYIRSMLKEDRS
ncbi:N,N'-diacetylchitobiose transport system permease protein [Microbacterium endophyticum]|uniref:N,N'-diacetylchitobiose transport system permease protein n=1 Tax=Microbacterium endophyticum TaxID=1526412 RepID=A0A7W4V2I8_9MICO|nr:sugar ABC transporter permease [Microbacterium endophyticum]MBB2975658.1 N,N'-diacetylchitobiose transport system permease protein [Microbacterium endophyticum]NIK35323.1 N,N'-diacetylchitobiose transport system permease protein [Microbacterium endophyticum]